MLIAAQHGQIFQLEAEADAWDDVSVEMRPAGLEMRILRSASLIKSDSAWLPIGRKRVRTMYVACRYVDMSKTSAGVPAAIRASCWRVKILVSVMSAA